MDLQSSPSIATLRTALDVPEGTLIGNHHRVLIQRTRGLIHTVKFVSKPRPGTCVAFAFGLSNDPVYKTIAQDFGRKVLDCIGSPQWGAYPIYEHGLCEAPERYGDVVRFFDKPPPGQALSDFLDYARSEGVFRMKLSRQLLPKKRVPSEGNSCG
jgi:hypothetical protein